MGCSHAPPPSQELSSMLREEEPSQSVCQLLIRSDWLLALLMWQAEGGGIEPVVRSQPRNLSQGLAGLQQQPV